MSSPTRTAPRRPAAAAAEETAPPARNRFVAGLLRVVGSFEVAVTCLLLMMVVVLVGTFEQAHRALFDVQKEIFGSLFFVKEIGGVPIPFPGGALVLGVLAANLVIGGVIRLRKGTRTIGILIAHLGVLLLFGGSLVESLWSDKGQMTLWERESGDEFQSYDEWEIVVRERLGGEQAREYVLPHGALDGLDADDLVRFTHEALPFDVAVTSWARNARPIPDGANGLETWRRVRSGIDGWSLWSVPPVTSSEETNLPGGVVTLAAKSGQDSPKTILWGRSEAPWVASVAGRRFEVDLRLRRWTLPFRIVLDKFEHEMHPGTGMAKRYSSYVTKREKGADREVHITMNEPLRHRGYTFYQSGFGPKDSRTGPYFSTFAVVYNPSDRVPMLACFVIAAGLLVHFGAVLFRHIQRERR